MKKIVLIAAMLMGMSFSVFGQDGDQTNNVRMGTARAAHVRTNLEKPFRLVITEGVNELLTKSEPFRLLGAELGAEWAGDQWIVWAYGRYTGGRSKSTFHVDGDTAVMEAQRTVISSVSPSPRGVVPLFEDGERKFSETFSVRNVGHHEISVVIGGRYRLKMGVEVKPMILPYACYAGAGTDTVIVELYGYFFNVPPLSNGAAMTIDGQSVPVSGSWLDKDMLRVDILIPWGEYKRLFNGNDVDDVERDVSIETDSPIGSLTQRLLFPSWRDVPHC